MEPAEQDNFCIASMFGVKLFQKIINRFCIILNIGFFNKTVFLVELVKLTSDNFFKYLLWFSFLPSNLFIYINFFLDHFFRDLFTVYTDWFHSCNLHSYIFVYREEVPKE